MATEAKDGSILAPALQDQGSERARRNIDTTKEKKDAITLMGEEIDFNNDPILPLSPGGTFGSPDPSTRNPREKALEQSFKYSLDSFKHKQNQFLTGRNHSQEQDREDRRYKKLMLRRRRLLRETEKAQDQEPVRVDSSNALPHFEYLDICGDVEVALPKELEGFGAMDLSNEAPNPDSPGRGSNDSRDSATSAFASLYDVSTEDISDAAARMLDQLEEDQANEPTEPLPDLSSLPFPPPRTLDNLICHYITCPVDECHTEGPYFHNGELGDQDHPYFKGSNPPPHVWDAYNRVIEGSSRLLDDEIVTNFWAWHVPPFYTIPEKPEAEVAEDQDMKDG